MRDADTFTESLFSIRRLDDFVPAFHPLRVIRKMTNTALVRMVPLFASMYEADVKSGRPSVAPEKLLRAMLLQVLFSVRSERQLMEQVLYNLLFRWFIRQVMVRGLKRVDQVFVLTMAACNLVRMRTLGQVCPVVA